MANKLHIKGRESVVINSKLNVDAGLYLSADYNGQGFELFNLKAFGRNDLDSGILTFNREDRICKPGELNYIILMTNLENKYKATGAEKLPDSPLDKPVMYTIGDDLELTIEDSAREAIRSIKKMKHLFDHILRGNPRDYMGGYSLN